MARLLKRLSMSLDPERTRSSLPEHSQAQPSSARAGTMASSTSFNDFSMHVSQDVDDHRSTKTAGSQGGNSEISQRRMSCEAQSSRGGQSVFTVGSAPAGSMLSPIATKALTIPRTSVAAILKRESVGTPRSFLDDSPGSIPTPHAGLSTEDSVASSPGQRASLADDGLPSSPRSPTTPGGRRRRAQKIHGMDYYEFCELVRAGSSM